MAEILPNASYVRNPAQPAQCSALASIGEHLQLEADETTRIWSLLETPQTVKTICRSLGDDADSTEIASLLSELYERELIEVSPDT